MFRSAFFALILAVATSSVATAAPFEFDKTHTTASFTATHLAFIKVHGAVPFVSGSMELGPNDLPATGKATFDLSKINSGDDRRDASLRSQYLETDQFPTMTFVVGKVTGTPQSFEMAGMLTLHGVSKPVTLKGSLLGVTTTKGKREIGYSATTTIDRRDFNINFGTGITNAPLSAGTDITIDIEAALLEQ